MRSPIKLKWVLPLAAAGVALATPAVADPAIWVLSDEDSEIYILGTVHVLPPELEWRSEAITAAFEDADTIWFEAPAADPAAQAEVQSLVLQYGMNAEGETLSAQISEEAAALLGEIAAELGMPADSLEPMRPWLVELTLSVLFLQARGYDVASGVDFVLWEQANADGKNVAYLETLEQQIRFLADLPPEIQSANLEQTLGTFDEMDQMLDDLVEAWADGDVATIDAVMNEAMRDTAPEVHEALLLDRNRNWVEVIRDTLAGSGSHFIAVGAAHMAGQENVIDLLRAEGFEVVGP